MTVPASHKQDGTGARRAAYAALLAALLFGLSTPFAKMLLGDVAPVLLASLFYLGSGTGLTALYLLGRKRMAETPLRRSDLPLLVGVLISGGVLAPVLLMIGLSTTPASTTSLLLNMELVFTVLLARFLFHESIGWRIGSGMALILAGGILLSLRTSGEAGLPAGSLAIAGACLCWGIDNNLTQKISGRSPVQIAGIKGLAAGTVNLVIAAGTGAALPSPGSIAGSLLVGCLCYGVSLALFVSALRHLGAARCSAYFSVAPFIGAAASIYLFHESPDTRFILGTLLMTLGIWLHLAERHLHEHTHDVLTHSHRHTHDGHHQHEHPEGTDPAEPHSHEHTHAPVTHAHRHYPDIHHRHSHRK